MTARLTFLAIVVFWLTMNALLWRMEFGVHGGDTPVPVQLVWRKILTAPDASSLSVYQGGDRMGYCEISTGIGQQMATLDEDKPPPPGFVAKAGYQIHLAGNVAMGDFTNRLKFDGRVRFASARQWQELNLRISAQLAVIEIHSLATNQTAHVKFSNAGVVVLEQDFSFSELQKPDTIIRALAGNFGDVFLGVADLSGLVPDASAQKIEWAARRTRARIATEAVPVYQLETSVLGHPVIVDVSTLGEILRVTLPGDITAHIDEWRSHD
jgi:hypothetical protein